MDGVIVGKREEGEKGGSFQGKGIKGRAVTLPRAQVFYFHPSLFFSYFAKRSKGTFS